MKQILPDVEKSMETSSQNPTAEPKVTDFDFEKADVEAPSRTRVSTLNSLTQHMGLTRSGALDFGNFSQVAEKKATGKPSDNSVFSESDTGLIAFVSPVIPHPCVLEIWDQAAKKMKTKAILLTQVSEQPSFDNFCSMSKVEGIPVTIDVVYFVSSPENKTFLGGIDQTLLKADIIVANGASSLATYQALKVAKRTKSKLLVWQNTPRPLSSYLPDTALQTSYEKSIWEREKTIREENLKCADLIITQDKDSAIWTYLDGVPSAKMFRCNRGYNFARVSSTLKTNRRNQLREAFGFKDLDFVFLQLGPVDALSGGIETLYAFKNLLQSHQKNSHDTKLVYCANGKSNASLRQAVQQLGLDPHVFFISLDEGSSMPLIGNQLHHLIYLADVVISSQQMQGNSTEHAHLDCTHDIFWAIVTGIAIITNGIGVGGEWVSRFAPTFVSGSINSQTKAMHTVQNMVLSKNVPWLQAARKSLENELPIEEALESFVLAVKQLEYNQQTPQTSEISALIKSAEQLIKNKQFTEAVGVIESTFTFPSLNLFEKACLHRLIGECFVKLGDLNSGFQSYQAAYDLDPLCAKTMIGLGTISLQKNSYTVAVPQFQRAVELDPNDDMASLGLSLAFQGLQELTESLNWCYRACKLNATNSVAIYSLVKLSYEMEDFSHALEILKTYTSLFPNDLKMSFTLAGILYATGDNVTALKQAKEILKLDPMNHRAHGLVGQINKKMELKKSA